MKRLNFPLIVFFACMILLSGFWSESVNAMSLEPYGAFGGGGGEGTYTQEGANLVFFEGKSFDFYIGAETTDVDGETGANTTNPTSIINGKVVDFNVKMNAATLGMRWKMSTSGRWTPYLLVGFVYGNADYTIDTNSAPGLTFSSTSGSTDIKSLRGGIGTDVALSDQWGLGLEINYTQGPPTFDVTMKETSSGKTEDLSLPDTPQKGLLGFVLRAKYTF